LEESWRSRRSRGTDRVTRSGSDGRMRCCTFRQAVSRSQRESRALRWRWRYRDHECTREHAKAGPGRRLYATDAVARRLAPLSDQNTTAAAGPDCAEPCAAVSFVFGSDTLAAGLCGTRAVGRDGLYGDHVAAGVFHKLAIGDRVLCD